MCERDCERRRELIVDELLRVDPEVDSDDRDESGDHIELLVSESARLRVDVELCEEVILRADDPPFDVFDLEISLRGVVDFSVSTSEEGEGEDHGIDGTQLGSSS